MATYIDSITLVLALVALFYYSHRVVRFPNKYYKLSLLAIAAYLLAQSSWTTAWFLGDLWGRDLANYVWFIFNTSVMVLFIMIRDKFK